MKKIDNNLLAISKAMLVDRDDWQYVSDEQKSTFFFITSRYLSKIYPKESKLLNSKLIDKATGMDIWFHFLKDKPYPKLMWSKSEKEKSEDIPEKDFELLYEKLGLNKKEDLNFLINRFPEYIEEELDYYKKQLKSKKKNG